MSVPLTPREAIYALVEAEAERTKKSISSVWAAIYDAFENSTNWAFRREAYINNTTILECIDQAGRMSELFALVKQLISAKKEKS